MFRYEIVRQGHFNCPVPPMEGKCGALQTQSFKYEVRLRVDRLDAQNFVIESQEIQRYFDRTYAKGRGMRNVLSCETIAVKAIEAFEKVLKAEGRELTFGVCKIWGFFPDAYVEVSFEPS